jgi:hypothetical protein
MSATILIDKSEVLVDEPSWVFRWSGVPPASSLP